MRNQHFPGWARPYEFAAELLTGLGKREEEARDMARCAQSRDACFRLVTTRANCRLPSSPLPISLLPQGRPSAPLVDSPGQL